ncbi:MAG: tRNA pseudouridine(55) synthase TruB [Erysipelotrichaceae bacterium]
MDGILLVNKEAGMTSHDVVFKLRRILGTKKIGHTGTLDPDVTGLLVILVGKACKALPYLEDTDKEYIGSFELGKMSTTEDIWGEITETKEVTPIADLQAVLDSFKGAQKQLPPMISSIKVNGKKLYEYARAGQSVERPLRDVYFHELRVLDAANHQFLARCSSGTYIRSLCRDIGAATNNLAIMNALVRTRVGNFHVDDAKTLEQIAQGDFALIPLRQALAYLPQISDANIVDVKNGKPLHLTTNEPRVCIVDGEEAIAIYERSHNGVYRMARGLW